MHSILFLVPGKIPFNHIQENKEYHIQSIFLSCKRSSLYFIMFYNNLQSLSGFISTTFQNLIKVGGPSQSSHKPSAQAAVTTSAPWVLAAAALTQPSFP